MPRILFILQKNVLLSFILSFTQVFFQMIYQLDLPYNLFQAYNAKTQEVEDVPSEWRKLTYKGTVSLVGLRLVQRG